MKAYLFPMALMAGVAAAQSTSTCAALYIVEACLTSERAKFAACDTNDWDCKCVNEENILTCYNNCPNDPRRSTEEGQKQIFCGYASQFPSTTKKTTLATTTTGTGSNTAATTDAATTTGTQAGQGTGTGSAASPSKTGGAADVALNAGGMLFAVAGVVAAVL